jgi:hypothetical protein
MAENNKQPETHIRLRYAEAEHLLKALDLMPENTQASVTHLDVKRQLTIIRDYWLKKERDRKAAQRTVISRKVKKK